SLLCLPGNHFHTEQNQTALQRQPIDPTKGLSKAFGPTGGGPRGGHRPRGKKKIGRGPPGLGFCRKGISLGCQFCIGPGGRCRQTVWGTVGTAYRGAQQEQTAKL